MKEHQNQSVSTRSNERGGQQIKTWLILFLTSQVQIVERGPVATEALNRLQELSPLQIELEDESAAHKGHQGAAGFNGESHFKLLIVSEEFRGMKPLQRHRRVYDVLGDLMSRIHALQIKAQTPEQWEASQEG